MIGDDVWADCQGALNAGIGRVILVQTGKYRMNDEEKWRNESSMGNRQEFLVRPSIVEAIDYILEILERDQQEELS